MAFPYEGESVSCVSDVMFLTQMIYMYTINWERKQHIIILHRNVLKKTNKRKPLKWPWHVLSGAASVASAAQLHLAGGRAGGLLGETDIVAAVETAQTQRPGAAQQHSQQRGPTAISLEEQKILLSLDRLNHQLYREHFVEAVCMIRPLNVMPFPFRATTPACYCL